LADDALLAMDALPDAVVVLDEHGTITHANPAAGRLLGARPDTLSGRLFDDAAELRDAAGNGWWRCTAKLRSMRAVRAVPPRELVLTVAGSERLVDLSATFVRDPGGRVSRTVCAIRDASSRRRSDRARAELVSMLAHELRSPLTSVKGFSSTLLHRWDRFGDEQKLHMLTTINADADRVTRLIGELLDVSRIEAGRLELRRQMIDLPYLAGEVAERFRLTHNEHTLETSFPPDFPDVYADRDKLEQVLTNLVENAVKYSDGGTVTIAGEVTDDHVEVGVRDQGEGMTADQLPLIFSKFYRRGGHGAPSGTGLGLYISKGLVEAHGGRVWATSQPEHGTEVRFLLPRGGLELAGIQ
jgi:PAS domain S-box-containing protein